jgi:hypothetical protein
MRVTALLRKVRGGSDLLAMRRLEVHTVKYHRYYGQFVLAPRVGFHNVHELSLIEIDEDTNLYYGPGVRVIQVLNGEGQQWVLVGEAYQSDPDRSSPANELRTATFRTIEDVVSHWSGRWVLIGYGRVLTDASAMLRCHYVMIDNPDIHTVRCYVFSSPNALQDIRYYAHTADPIEDRRALTAGWVVPPRSGYKQVRLLLPSQALNYRNGTIEPRYVFSSLVQASDYTQQIQEICRRYTTIMGNMAKTHDNLWIALSGGRDSRLVLSAAYAAGVCAKTYTFKRSHFLMSEADRYLPAQISSTLGYVHHMVQRKKEQEEKHQLFDKLMIAYQRTPSSFYSYYVHGYLDGFGQDAVLVNGLCGELGRGYYTRKLSANVTPRELSRQLYAQTTHNRNGLYDLWQWWEKHPIPMLDRRERFYWEARLAGWASVASYQVHYVMQEQNVKYIPALNCRYVYERIMHIDERARITGGHIKDMIAYLCPQLSHFPYNPPEPEYKRFASKIRELPRFITRKLRVSW